MQKLRKLLAPVGLAFAVGMFAFGLQLASPQVASPQVAAPQVAPARVAGAAGVIEPGWRYTNGYWNYWQPDDRAWYYTDGRAWYTYGDNAWKVYNFDRKFGNDAFYREGYTIPKPGPDIVVPRHRVYVPK